MIYMATVMRMITMIMMMIPYTSLSLQQLLLWLSLTDLHNLKQITLCLILSDCTLFLVTPVETALSPNKGTVSQAPGLLLSAPADSSVCTPFHSINPLHKHIAV